MFVKKILITCLAFFVLYDAHTQLPALQQLDSLAGKYISALRSIPGETTWLQSDRPVYRVGEIIWFKAFVMNRVSQKPSRLSSILYVDMVDERDTIVNQCLLNASLFKTDGSFVLADSLATGHYWLRAYTKLSLANRESPLFVQAVYVINPLKPDRHPTAENKKGKENNLANDSVYVQFFPEGGTVVGGANTLIAIKTTNEKGVPISVSGYVKDNRDSLVASVQTNANGLGKISYFSWTWHSYQLHINHGSKRGLVYTIQPVNFFAGQLAVIEKNGIKRLRVVLEDSIFRKDKTTYVLGLSGDSLCFSGVGRGAYELVIPEYRFPKGIAHFLLFDEQKKLLSERTMYVEGSEPIVMISSDKPVYGAREKVTLSIQVTGADKKPEVASFLAEVNDITRETFYDPIKPLKRQVPLENGLLYSDKSLPAAQKYTAEDWDLLLLTQQIGFSQQAVSIMNKGVANNINDEEDSSLYIKGKVVDDRNIPLSKKIVTLFGELKTKVFETDTTNELGIFCFPFTAYDDQTKFNLQVTDAPGRLLPAKILLDKMLHIPRIVTPANLKQRFVVEEIETVRKALVLQSQKDTVMQKRGKEWLMDVTVKGLIRKDPGYDTKKRMSLFSHIVPPEALLRLGSNNLGIVIFRVPGIHLRNGYVTVRGGNSFEVGQQTEPLLIIDGMPVPTDTSDKMPGSETSPLMLALNRIDPSQVEFIEVLTGPEAAIYGVRGGNGVIIVNTRSRQLVDEPDKINGIRNLAVRGFQVPEIFERRDYSVKENKMSKMPDSRSFIYWNGDGLTDSNGKAVFSFYTADAVTTYTVSITGITASGVRFQKQITLERK